MGFDIKKTLPDYINEESVKQKFNFMLCKYLKSEYVTLVSNGTVALEVALRSLRLKRGDKVIIPDLSFIATATAVANCGLIPIYCNVDEEFYGITLEKLKNRYNANKDVKAIIVVHFGGFVDRDILEISKFCKEKDIYLIEDCAQAFSCEINKQHVGTIGDLGTFSFQSSKLISSGEGGAIVTNNKELMKRCEAISNWGLHSKNEPREINYATSNFRLSALQCHFLIMQLEKIDDIIFEHEGYIKKLILLCEKYNIKISMPEVNEDIVDCPFYFPIYSRVKYSTLEPRSEYPMRDSQMVRTILIEFFPDLVEIYDRVNIHDSEDKSSYLLLEGKDFINIWNCHDNLEETILHYVV